MLIKQSRPGQRIPTIDVLVIEVGYFHRALFHSLTPTSSFPSSTPQSSREQIGALGLEGAEALRKSRRAVTTLLSEYRWVHTLSGSLVLVRKGSRFEAVALQRNESMSRLAPETSTERAVQRGHEAGYATGWAAGRRRQRGRNSGSPLQPPGHDSPTEQNRRYRRQKARARGALGQTGKIDAQRKERQAYVT